MTSRLAMRMAADAAATWDQYQEEQAAIAHMIWLGYSFSQATSGIAWAIDQAEKEQSERSEQESRLKDLSDLDAPRLDPTEKRRKF